MLLHASADLWTVSFKLSETRAFAGYIAYACPFTLPTPLAILRGLFSLGFARTYSWCNGRKRYPIPCLWRVAKPHSSGRKRPRHTGAFASSTSPRCCWCREHNQRRSVRSWLIPFNIDARHAHDRTSRTPIELVKCKMQVQMLAVPAAAAASPLPVPSTVLASVVVRNLPGPYAILRDVIRADGFRGLWLGQMGTLIRETGGSAAWFGTKELVSKLLRRNEPERQLRPWESALSGACAGAAYNLAFFPADTVKSTIQTEAELRPETVGQRSFGAVAKELYRAQGVRGLYAGCGITVARSIPSSALIFWIYDGLRARFG
jgi:Mitochondrial carrier protein